MLNKLFLKPLSLVYQEIMRARNLAFDLNLLSSAKSSLPVISVGNLTLGGSGKSPFTIYIAEKLLARGAKPAILSRGYGGTTQGPHLVNKNDLAIKVGDEPLMHCLRLSPAVGVFVSRNRSAGAQAIEKTGDYNIIILDDGFQHRWLKRDVDIVLVDISHDRAQKNWLNGDVVPAGRLREARDYALGRASCLIFVSRSVEHPPRIEQFGFQEVLPPRFPYFFVTMRAVGIIDVYSKEQIPLSQLKDREYNAVSAIAVPESFFFMLRELGLNLGKTVSFKDHYCYSEKDWHDLKPSVSSPVITTEKDAVKLAPYVDRANCLYALRIAPEFSNKTSEDKFWQLLDALSIKVSD